jgi:TolB-like protein/tetratricopeptide (TPR) repeat protein
MSSLVAGFEYDIFISYRHNDNQDGWVTDFVYGLEKELKATIKQPITIYFDKNASDGLLENHDVDRSLEGKLKCLIFIPIVSQTYCDPASFAWTQEFCVFNRQSDIIGKNVKLSNGNVASRILPVIIHELDGDDRLTIEIEIGSPLRGIDFTCKLPGVNRPLTPADSAEKNQSKILYRDQLNKTAVAIKELITAIRNPHSGISESLPASTAAKPRKKLKALIAVATFLVLAAASFFIFQRVQGNEKDLVNKSIAVLPFVDMSPDKSQEYLGDGVAEDIITSLSRLKDLKVIGRTSSFQFKGEKIDLRKIGEQLGVSTILEGSVMKSGSTLRITAQLISVDDGAHIWSERFDRPAQDLFAVHDEISRTIAEKMKVTLLVTPANSKTPTDNPEAYNAFVQGRFFYENNTDSTANDKAMEFFRESIAIDSGFAMPWTYLSMCYLRQGTSSRSPAFSKAKQATLRAYELDPSSGVAIVNLAEILETEFDMAAAHEKIQLALKLDPDNPYVLRNAGRYYTDIGKTREAIAFCKRSLQNDPIQQMALVYLILAYTYDEDCPNAEATIAFYKRIYSDTQLAWRYGSQLCTAIQGGQVNLAGLTDVGTNTLLAISKFQSGDIRGANEHCKKLEALCPDKCAYNVAKAYAYGDNNDKALLWLEKAYANRERGFIRLKVDPAFKALREEPRFTELLRLMKFPD